MASTVAGAVRFRLASSTSFICRQCRISTPAGASTTGMPFRPSSRIVSAGAHFSTSRTTCSKPQLSLNTGGKARPINVLFTRAKSGLWGTLGTARSAYRRLTTTEVDKFLTEQSKEAVKKSSWPDVNDKAVGYWLLGSAGLVFTIVVVGGLTRLTESGLSITEWKPVTGTLPPLSQADWEAEFAKYRDSPEFRILNPTMSLSEYKFIYFMEWSHRLLGRVIGVGFLLPAIYFVARRRVTPSMAWKLGGITLGIGFQGFIGWWMVKSGLQDDLFQEPGAHPRVSQYRLTAHLGAAFAVYSAMLYAGISVIREQKMLKDPRKAIELIKKRNVPALIPLRIFVAMVTGLVFTTAMSGALVAGLDAGLVYNKFPYMGNGFIPPQTELFDTFYSREPPPHKDLLWRNLLENPVTVQLDHRILATTTFFTILTLWGYGRGLHTRRALTPEARKGILGLVHIVSLQVALGIATLIYLVPHSLASLHQANSLALLSGCLILGSRVWVPKALMKVAEKRVMMMRKDILVGSK